MGRKSAMTSPVVSIVIPTYNQADLLQEALESVLRQTFTAWEAVIINNYSADHTEAVARAFTDPRLRLVNFRNYGIIGASRNEGVRQTSGELVAFLDSDDTWEPTKLERVLDCFAQPGVDLVCHDEWLWKNGQKNQLLRYGPYSSYDDLLFKGNCVSPSATVLRRLKFLEVRGFSQERGLAGVEDYDLWLRLARAGCLFHYLHEPLGSFRVHGESFSSKIEYHCANGLHLLEAHFAQWPRQTPYYRYLMRKRRSDIYRGAARACLQNGSHGEARRYLHQAIKEDPLSWKAWMLAVLSLAGVKV
jgi:glycosyltransferase involved in cell wall biosynthesis